MTDQAIVGGEERARVLDAIERALFAARAPGLVHMWDAERARAVEFERDYPGYLKGSGLITDVMRDAAIATEAAMLTFAAEASGIEELQWPADAAFALGDLVQKKGRASWRGKVVGWYRTDLTALGLAVESIFEPGSVQIYPQTTLEPLPNIDCSGLAQEAARNTKPQEPTL